MARTRKLKNGRVVKIKGQAPTWAGQGADFMEGFGQSRNKWVAGLARPCWHGLAGRAVPAPECAAAA
jgi:hypothetical protein